MEKIFSILAIIILCAVMGCLTYLQLKLSLLLLPISIVFIIVCGIIGVFSEKK